MSDLIHKLREAFEEKEYRHTYVNEFLNSWIATQIKVLREQRGWSQKDLAERADMLQPRISALENINYSSWSVKTLRKLAEAFDLTLRISFESFGNRIRDFDSFSREYLERASFDSDAVFERSGIEQRFITSTALSQANKDLIPDQKIITFLGYLERKKHTTAEEAKSEVPGNKVPQKEGKRHGVAVS